MNDSELAEAFIQLFDAIPASKWCCYTVVDNEGRRCAFGHCPSKGPQGCRALSELFFRHNLFVPSINDGYNPNPKFSQPTPKLRIIAALRYIQTL